VPEIPLTENMVSLVDFEIFPLAMLQAPFEDVVQFTEEPPTVKLPETTAPCTRAPCASFTVKLTVARHPLRTAAPAPLSEAIEAATVVASEDSPAEVVPTYNSRLGDPDPASRTLSLQPLSRPRSPELPWPRA
jgi:hypothetical protein